MKNPWPLFAIAVLAITLAIAAVAPRVDDTPNATALRSADLVMVDHDDGSIDVRDARTDALVQTLPPETNAFLRVVLAGQVRERRREGLGQRSLPFHLTRWSDGRLTLDDAATRKRIELNAFGATNADAFGRLLDLTPPAASPAPAPASP